MTPDALVARSFDAAPSKTTEEIRDLATELSAAYDNLAATQARCNELLEEKRALAAEVARYRYRNNELEKAMLEELARIGQEQEEVPWGALNRIADALHQISVDNGWYETEPSISDFCANVHAEVSELFEAHRNGTLHEQCDKETPRLLTRFAEEACDVITRVLCFSAFHGIDISDAVAMKADVNRKRGWRHGGKRV